ncbi:isocitrate/isopropylmalate dehydrogenase family protein [Micromonospora siamensis]|uniref:3-isopropylmalate dehydrogenase n=1 Tax=Micromonospora siamensis TaxID=299152 RepID=A0A1C5HEE5_9ACTN|nr:isocitrate/isopropylmalate dehydrogenase family protein [Micromonospora siamensis]SCG44392.1 3-isopropylmalate dehydrogenase [Micromonospora siamensis]
MMNTIAVIPGDGVGPEVAREATETVTALGLDLTFDVLDHINADTYLETGVAMSEDDLQRVRRAGGVLFGAVGDPRVSSTGYARDILLRLRFEFDLYVNHRPAALLHDRVSPLRDPARRAIDLVVVRENTEGLYLGVGGVLRGGTKDEVAIDEEVNTYLGVSRILDYAFSVARRSVCMVDKSNAVRHGGQLWQRCWCEAVARRPDVETSHLYVDAAAMNLVADPTRFDVVVTNNSYGDILSDLTAQLAGGIGSAASVNLNPETGFALFEPVHGSAPDIAGKGIANPIGALESAALLLDRHGHSGEARALRDAVRRTVAAGRCTPDLGGTLTTAQAGAAIRAELLATGW